MNEMADIIDSTDDGKYDKFPPTTLCCKLIKISENGDQRAGK